MVLMEYKSISIFLDRKRCMGCTNCIKRCPTEAIRVRNGKAKIFASRCIECGECIRICQHSAPIPQADKRENIKQFKYTVVLPDPVVFGQFKLKYTPRQILAAAAALGFDSVYEMGRAADAVTIALQEFIKENRDGGPWISSACPAVIRLIQVRFHTLTEQIVPILSPIEVAARQAKDEISQRLGISREEIGCFYLTPCPSQVTAIKSPYHLERSYVDGALSISSLYSELRYLLPKIKNQDEPVKTTVSGLKWCRTGGQTKAVRSENYLAVAVDGIHNLHKLFEEIELGKFENNINFIECQCCQGGCVGGPFTVENPFVARVLLKQRQTQFRPKLDAGETQEIQDRYHQGYYRAEKKVEPFPVMSLSKNIAKAIDVMEQAEIILSQLPGLDCGSCGCPTCRILAEDIACGIATEMDCFFRLREHVQFLAEQMLALALKVPPLTPVQYQIMQTQREVLKFAKRVPPVIGKQSKKKREGLVE
jgi:iron only hydrogenase large subunit-like protein